MKNLDGGSWSEKLSNTYGLFIGNPSKESKIIEFEIILLYKYKIEQTEVVSRLLFTFLLTNYTNYKNVWSDRTFTFS